MPEFNPNVIGGLEIGVLLATLLYGMGTVQTYLYYRNFPKDSRRMKTTVRMGRTSISILNPRVLTFF